MDKKYYEFREQAVHDYLQATSSNKPFVTSELESIQYIKQFIVFEEGHMFLHFDKKSQTIINKPMSRSDKNKIKEMRIELLEKI